MEKTNLRIERAKLNITQEELSDETGICRQTIHLIEKKKVDPKLSTALKIARFFKMRVEKLFEENIENK